MDNVKYNLLNDVCISNGGKLLTKNSTEINTNTKLKYSCKEGHKWETTYHSVIKGTWCEKCRRVEMFEKIRINQSKKILSHLKIILKEKKGLLLKGEYINQQSKFKFKCKEGHVFEISPSLIVQRGTWCDKCSRKDINDKKNKLKGEILIKQIQSIVKYKEGKVLENDYTNPKSKFKFKCKEGHVWETLPYLIIKGHWCSKCSNEETINKQRGNIETTLNYIKEKKGKYISGVYENQLSKILVECEKGHRWEVRCNSLLSKKSWCRECVGTKKRNIEEMLVIGKERGGKCLSKVYINDFTKLEWECCDGHNFWTSPNNIKHGKWCPECSSGFYERICRFYFEKIFEKKFIKVRPDWLKNSKTNQNLEIDGYNEELKIGFEHQGTQHYDNETYYSKPDVFDNDKLKKRLCKKQGIKLIEIPELISMTKIKSLKSFIYKELNKQNISPKISEKDLEISDFDLYTYTRNKERIEIEEIVKEKLNNYEYRIIGFKYDGEHKVDFECNKQHSSSIRIRRVLDNEISCKICLHMNDTSGKIRFPTIRKKRSNNIEVLDKVNYLKDKVNNKLKSEKGNIISGEIHNGNSVLKIECINKHVYKTNISNFIRRGCSECSKMKKIKIETLEKFITNKGGKILELEYNDGKYEFQIKCNYGHIFKINNYSLRKRIWCPNCKLDRKTIKKSLRIDELKKQVKELNGVCLDIIPNQDNKLKFSCKNKHIFYSTMNNVLYGYWCKKCSNIKRTTDTLPNRKNKVIKFINSKKGKILTTELTYNYDEEIKLECERGHIWDSSIRNIISNNWCRTCGLLDRWEKDKITIKEINSYIKGRGGKCLSKEYINSSKDKLKFICKEGHTWESIWSNVKKGSWCPTCSKSHKK